MDGSAGEVSSLCPNTVRALLSPLSPCALPIHLSLTLPFLLIILLVILPQLPLIRDSPYRPRDYCPEPVLPEWKRERTSNRWRALWRALCAGEMGIRGVALGGVVRSLLVGREGRSGDVVRLLHAIAVLLIWSFNFSLPPRHVTPSTRTLLLTLPLMLPPLITSIHIAHFTYSHALPFPLWPTLRPEVFPSVWSVVGLGFDLVMTIGVGVMVLGMQVGESEERVIPWDEGKRVKEIGDGWVSSLTCGFLVAGNARPWKEDWKRAGSTTRRKDDILEQDSETGPESSGSYSSEQDSLLTSHQRSGGGLGGGYAATEDVNPISEAELGTESLNESCSAPPSADKAYWNSLGYQGPSPEMTSSIWSSLRLGWMESLFRVGYHKDLQENDVWALSPGFRTKTLSEAWGRLKGKTVYTKLWRANSYDLTLIAIFAWLATAAKYTAPYTLKRILYACFLLELHLCYRQLISLTIQRQAIADPTPANRANAYLYAFVAFVASVIGAELEALHGWHSRRAGSRSKTALVAEIYKKALRRRDMSGAPASREDVGTDNKGKTKSADQKKLQGKGKKGDDTFNADIGKIVNVISADANQVFRRLAGSAQVFQAPVELIVCTTFLYQVLGYSAFVGLVVFALVIPINSYLGKRGIGLAKAVMASKDRRMKVMNELILGIKSIKLFGWQTRWKEKAILAYQDELDCLMNSRTNSLMYSTIWDLAPIAINLLSFASYLFIAKRELDVATAFTAIALLNMLHRPLGTLPRTFLEVLQARVSLDRIAAFLDEPEIPFAALETAETQSGSAANGIDEASGIRIESATLGWSSEKCLQLGTHAPDGARTFRLTDINLAVEEGSVTVITGAVSSGKTSLLIAMLGEMRVLRGSVHTPRSKALKAGLRDSVAFCAQNPWIESGVIRSIILFGSPMDQERYEQTLDVCCLKEDLEQFEDGDMTEIGLRGINLSGGTRARVALARAVYSRSAYLLLDDPWAAVDVVVGRRLVKNLLVDRRLMKGKTVVVVTHHLDLLLSSNNIGCIVRMAEGRISEIKTAKQVIDEGKTSDPYLDDPAHISAEVQVVESVVKPERRKPKKLINAEERLFGNVRWKTYRSYMQASGASVWIGIISTLVTQKAFTQFQRYWLKVWGEAYTATAGHKVLPPSIVDLNFRAVEYTIISRPPAGSNPGYYLGIYAEISLGASVLNLMQQYIAYTGSVRAVSRMHDSMLGAVLASPAIFFDQQPAGRILNRFSSDLQLIAGTLGTTLRSVLGLFGAALANFITLTLIEPRVSAVCAVALTGYYLLTQLYLRSARDLRRIISVARSPLFTQFGEVIDGILTVRAFDAGPRLTEEMYKTVDWMQSSIYLWQGCNRWLILNVEVLGATIIFIVTILVLGGPQTSSGSVGIAIVTAQAFVNNVLWISRDWTNLEQAFNGVERVEEYLANPQEAPVHIASTCPATSWPDSGPHGSTRKDRFLVVKDLRVRYAHDSPEVLRGVSFTLGSRERLAIVGRTGSGKSTLAMSLLRFCEPSAGTVVLDGIDISTIGLEDLRLRVTYVPQDPNLFSGTLRSSLDPFQEYGDQELLDALRKVQLRVSTDEEQKVNLDSDVVAGGTNWSQGQRQLICLARSIVRQSALIISDEATSAVDPATDALIQGVIADNFKDTALITIAHRLSSIIRFDKVLVMTNGEVGETGEPWELLQRDGMFSHMVAESGQEETLRQAAKEAFEARRSVS